MSKGLKVFITYAHKNSEAKDKLITYLAVMKQNGLIDVWHDNEILPGDKWRDAIFNNLADSDILLYLTCPYSLASENCNKELTAALNPNIRVIPIILEHCDWQNHHLSEFQALPDKGKPINDINEWNPESKGWQNVVDGIRKVVTAIQSQSDLDSSISKEELQSEVAFQQGNVLMMLRQIDVAIEVYRYAIDLNSYNTGAYNNRGIAYGKKDEYELAIKDLTKAIELDPSFIIAYYNRGIAYRQQGDSELAIKDLTKAIELDPSFIVAYIKRGIAYGNTGKLDSAIEDFTKAIELNSEDAEAYENRGVTYSKKGNFDFAINDFTKAIELNPEDANTYKNRGLAYGIKGNFDFAINDYTKAINLNPEDANAYKNRGIVYEHKGKVDLAINDCTKAIELNPEDASTYKNRGTIFFQQKRKVDLAIIDYTKAIELNCDYAEVYYNRGIAYSSKGVFGLAVDDFTKVIELNPNNANSYCSRGIAHLHLKNWHEAKSDLTIARNMRLNIIASFHNIFGSVANFEQITGIRLPADIAAMLTP